MPKRIHHEEHEGHEEWNSMTKFQTTKSKKKLVPLAKSAKKSVA
jgi:hypothetical protein